MTFCFYTNKYVKELYVGKEHNDVKTIITTLMSTNGLSMNTTGILHTQGNSFVM